MIYLSGGVLILTMILVMVAVIILGMGMPTSASYLIGAILLAPALINFGIMPIAAHMFIFYFAVISMITPPVALASFTAASLSGADLWRTGITAFKIALPGFLIPYVFVYNNSLLLQGSWMDILWVTATTAVGVIGFAGGTTGYFARRATNIERGFLLVGAVLLIVPEVITDFVGMGILAGIFAWQKYRRPAEETAAVMEGK
jgi:TRAP-type uncharacterized transport system fused permease subunit